jgi:CheY-like chemotaxis protein
MNTDQPLIVLIDDDEGINYINKRILEIHEIGGPITSYISAVEALNFLTENHKQNKALPKLILLDLMMPIMNGFEFLEELEKLDLDLPAEFKIIVLSSTELEEDIDRAKKNKYVINFFSKPISKENIEYLKNLFSK